MKGFAIIAAMALSLLAAGAAGAQGWGGHGRGGGGHGFFGGFGGFGGRGFGAPAMRGGPMREGQMREGQMREGQMREGMRGGGMRAPSPVREAPMRGPAYPRGVPGRPFPGGMGGGYAPYAEPLPAPRGGFRRGEFMPRGLSGAAVADPRSHRLRSPPPGYVWYGVGRDAYLVQRSTGLILDTAPGSYW